MIEFKDKIESMYKFFTLFFCCAVAMAQDTIIPLWPKGIPNRIETDVKEIHEKGDMLVIRKVQRPEIEVYLPTKQSATGKAVLIFPGGGYHVLVYDWEGTDIAKFLNGKGIAGIVVKYRMPDSETMTEKHKVPLIDAQRAIRLVRSKAADWNIDERQIGIIGFSAGGHLASTLGTHFKEKIYQPQDKIDSLNARPDFMALVYPVITFTRSTAHKWCKETLLGENPTEALVKHYSNELQVTSETPPTLLIHATDDKDVHVENSLLFYTSLKANGVKAAMHIYPRGGHGFSLARKDNYVRGWTERLFEWMEALE